MQKILCIFLLGIVLISCSENQKKNVESETEKSGSEVINSGDDSQSGSGKTLQVIPLEKSLDQLSLSEVKNSVYREGGAQGLKEKIKSLESSENIEDVKKSLYLKSFVGNNGEALFQRKTLCENNESFCNKVQVNISSYFPENYKGQVLNYVDMSLNNTTPTSLAGNNTFSLYDDFVHRIKLTKKGYLDFYHKISVDSKSSGGFSINPKFLSADKKVSIDSQKPYTTKTNNYTFNIDRNSFTFPDGTRVEGNIDVYFFDIDGTEGSLNVLNLDSFNSETLDYEGGSMITHGMPLVKAYSGEIELKMSKPIVGTGKILNQEAMPGMNLVDVPKGEYLDMNELAEYNIPPFWNLDQDYGVWKSSKMKILDLKGNFEFKLF